MADSTAQLSEMENIEFTRRIDIARACLAYAERLFHDKISFEHQIKEGERRLKNKLLWVVLVFSFVTSYFIDAPSLVNAILSDKVGLTSFTAIAASIYMGSVVYLLNSFKGRHSRKINEIYELQVMWASAIGAATLFDLERFFEPDLGIVRDNEDFQNWWDEQENSILSQVCSYEKYEAIIEAEAKRRERFAESKREFQDKKNTES